MRRQVYVDELDVRHLVETLQQSQELTQPLRLRARPATDHLDLEGDEE